MFFKPAYLEYKNNDELFHFCGDTVLKGEESAFSAARRIFAGIAENNGSGTKKSLKTRSLPVKTTTFVKGIPERLYSLAAAARGNKEAYAAEIGEDTVIYAETANGFRYACAEIADIAMENGGVGPCTLVDAPDCAVRGYRVYLPGRARFAEFFAMVDLLERYKYNSMIIEIGGAMEYKRHPEINEAWSRFAADTHRYTGRAHETQYGYPWDKDSIHTDNGEGDVLTQEEVRGIIDYCESRGLEVIPEAPSLSHSDYICLAHPELRERAEDPYPDTYCPSNPESYAIVFDILDEICALFDPKSVNIGHDEYYSMALCDKCRGKEPFELYAADITKIHDYLAKKGVKTLMWGEKLLPVLTPDGMMYGGAGTDRISRSRGCRITVPPLYRCATLIPKDVTMLNWYYSFGEQYDFVYHTHGFRMLYGNLAVSGVRNWRARKNRGCDGGFVSNWGSNEPEYMQRNLQYSGLFTAAYAFWSAEYDSCMLDELILRSMREAVVAGASRIKGRAIEITHTCARDIPHKYFYDGVFIVPSEYALGKYVITYSDGATAELPVSFGLNIGPSDLSIPLSDPRVSQLTGTAYPVDGADGKRYFRAVFADPNPEKTVAGIKYVSDSDDIISIKEISFS